MDHDDVGDSDRFAQHDDPRSTMSKIYVVSGASGFIGATIVQQLLAERPDVHVRALVRDATAADKTAHLVALPGAAERLSLHSALLGDATAYAEACRGATALIHVARQAHHGAALASPYFYEAEDVQKEIIEPAVKGTQVALEAAVAEGVARVVVTSSGGAVMHFDVADGHVMTADDWNNWSSEKIMPYMYSKTLAEKAAWEFKDRLPGLVVVNPFLVLGPLVHANSLSTSNKRLLGYFAGVGPSPQMPRLAVADVRDVARAHVLAAEHPDAPHKRLLVASAVLHTSELLAELRRWAAAEAPELVERIVPDAADDPSLPVKTWGVDSAPVRALGLEMHDALETVADTARSLKQHGFFDAKKQE